MTRTQFAVENSPCQVTNKVTLDNLFEGLRTGREILVEFIRW